MKVYAIFDRKAQAYEMTTLPLFANDEIAKRSFALALEQKALGGVIAHNPEDFELYCLGDFDQKTGWIKSEAAFVCALLDLIKKEAENVPAN